MLFYFHVSGQDTKKFVGTLGCSFWHSFRYIRTLFKSAITLFVGFQATSCFEKRKIYKLFF